MLTYNDFTILIKEGLVKTHTLTTCHNVIDNTVGELGYWHNILYNFSANTFIIQFDDIPTINHLEYLNHVLNKLGYYPYHIKVINNSNMKNDFPWIDLEYYEKITKNKKSVYLYFEAKFDEKLQFLPKNLYHCTNINNLSKIGKHGLKPSFEAKSDYRPDRIYFSLSYNDVISVKQKMVLIDKTNNINNTYIILKITNTENIYKFDLYKDPRSNGVYTYNHINPNNILKEVNKKFIALNGKL